MMKGAVTGTLLMVHAKLLLHADAWGDPLAVSTENRGIEHRLDALENTSCCLWFRNPDDQMGG
jgi:hypothetical protein